jgi:hypothetical protein
MLGMALFSFVRRGEHSDSNRYASCTWGLDIFVKFAIVSYPPDCVSVHYPMDWAEYNERTEI